MLSADHVFSIFWQHGCKQQYLFSYYNCTYTRISGKQWLKDDIFIHEHYNKYNNIALNHWYSYQIWQSVEGRRLTESAVCRISSGMSALVADKDSWPASGVRMFLIYHIWMGLEEIARGSASGKQPGFSSKYTRATWMMAPRSSHQSMSDHA